MFLEMLFSDFIFYKMLNGDIYYKYVCWIYWNFRKNNVVVDC